MKREEHHMAKRLVNEIRLSELGIYQLWEEDSERLPRSRHDLEPDSEAYFRWLETFTSFRFNGKEGHFTARRETRQRGESYWYAYRRQGKQFSQYLGTTDKLTLAHLEDTAKKLAALCSVQPTKKTTRKRPVQRAVLFARIERLEKELETERAQRQAKELEQEQIIEQQRARIRQLEAAAKTKRETMGL
jgi:hypothetical protein